MSNIEIMRRSARHWQEVAQMVDLGGMGKKVTFPIREASLALRIPQENLRRMGQRGQSLGIEVRGPSVEVILKGSEIDRKKAYRFLYGFVQNLDKPAALGRFLETNKIPPELLTVIPDFRETVEVAKKSALPDEDYALLAVETYTLWLSLKDKSGLPNPLQVLANKY